MPFSLPATLPSSLRTLVEHHLTQWVGAVGQAGLEAELARLGEPTRAELERVLAGSDFVAEQLRRDPHMLWRLLDDQRLHRSLRSGEMAELLAGALRDVDTEEQMAQALRRFRQQQQVRIIWRDITRQAATMETTRDLSDMADACLEQAYRWVYSQLVEGFGTPCDEEGVPQHLVILGMGKLGAQELNLSSDIDLIFAFPAQGETSGGRRSLSNQEFFTRAGQRLIRLLDEVTLDGFVFRVDMRLRPYGDSGALVFSFNALEQYYQSQGRDWERYAMIKARVVAGDPA